MPRPGFWRFVRTTAGIARKPLFDHLYHQGTSPGEFRFVPGTDFAILPAWGKLPPFVLFRADQYRPGPPYRVDSKKYAEDFNEIRNLGGDGVTTLSARTSEQTEIALFWLEDSPLGWNRIARVVAAARGLGLWETARLLALLNLAMADGYIANWDTKHYYNRWRPITAIREAATDGNPDTQADPTWMSLAPTPPGPEYDSGHALEGAAAAEVMRRFFGTDNIAFTTCSTTLPPGSTCADPNRVTRSFSSFSQAAAENALSRFSLGITFEMPSIRDCSTAAASAIILSFTSCDRSDRARNRLKLAWSLPSGECGVSDASGAGHLVGRISKRAVMVSVVEMRRFIFEE